MKRFILLITCYSILTSCQNNTNQQTTSAGDTLKVGAKGTTQTSADKSVPDLPFIGKRAFETRPGVSGTGTPHRYIEILKNGDVYFSFSQINQADQTETEERFYAGKFTPYMKSYFKKWFDETAYYEITREKIYEVDARHNRITSDECCPVDNYEEGKNCICESGYVE